MIAPTTVDFPDPDSPASPTASLGATERLIPSTAVKRRPSLSVKETRSPLISSSGDAASAPSGSWRT